ncbi:hypothetical protein B0H66DRAFT_531219 [Apodospora peruviana]|uniref:Uncharacterized protein n=1 Tax=Apodospora peruviana TaxID=516989 RepID=A0AAE0M725_9PEZI|nr:hypothetical protein B0H66DRAFT_531219 [Apodospora peruviana]
MSSHRNSLSDGWENVDDNMSVLSFSDSGDDATPTASSEENHTTSQPTPAEAANHHPAVASLHLSLPIRSRPAPTTAESPVLPGSIDETSSSACLVSDDKSPLNNGKAPESWSDAHTGPASREPSYMTGTEAQQAPEVPFKDPPSSAYNYGSDADNMEIDSVEDISFNHDSYAVDPKFLQKTVHQVRNSLDDTVHNLSTIPSFTEVREKSIGLCSLLSRQVSELTPIISGYAMICSTTSREPPLDPGLRSWLSGVRHNLSNLQKEVRYISKFVCRDGDARWTDPSTSCFPNLIQIWHNLDEFEKKMSDFLPIMRVDFNEFQTEKMNIPIAPPAADLDSPTGRSAPIDIPQPGSNSSAVGMLGTGQQLAHQIPSNQVWRLRHELYHMKDVIQQVVVRLNNATGLSSSAAALASDISKMYSKLFDTISVALSNHGSDWIDSGLSGGLTYAEFLGLDTECIRDFAAQLESTLQSMGANNNPRRQHVAELADVPRTAMRTTIENYQLENLEMLVLVLGATLTPQRN